MHNTFALGAFCMHTGAVAVVALGPRDVCRIAAKSDVDHRTVERFLRGEVARRNSRARSRIICAMRELGLAEHIPRPGVARA
jgi:hypothetical protein